MSDDWQVGDLAVAVKFSGKRVDPRNRMKKGTIKRVEGIIDWYGDKGLIFDQRSNHCTGAFLARCFRKIRPDKHEDCEPEFVELLNRIRRSKKVRA